MVHSRNRTSERVDITDHDHLSGGVDFLEMGGGGTKIEGCICI